MWTKQRNANSWFQTELQSNRIWIYISNTECIDHDWIKHDLKRCLMNTNEKRKKQKKRMLK